MTLMELMVSLAILSIMILMANSLLVRSRRTIRLAQDVIKANADARAVIDRLRADIPSVTKEGFLLIGTRRILYRTDPADPATQSMEELPYLFFTTVSTYRSVRDPVSANAATIDYGHGAQDPGTPADPVDDFCIPVLCRRARLHDLGGSTTGDQLGSALVEYRADLHNPRVSIHNRILASTPPEPPRAHPPLLTLPANSLAAVTNLWPYMIGELRDLKIQWTDGTKGADGRLLWYGKDAPRSAGWEDRGADSQDTNPTVGPEYNLSFGTANPELYGALWTFKKTDNWPKAIRFELYLGDPLRYYEVVVSLLN